jgi:hypothetical protein
LEELEELEELHGQCGWRCEHQYAPGDPEGHEEEEEEEQSLQQWQH